MAIAFDAFSSSLTFQATPITIAHVPVGTPRGVLLLISVDTTGSDATTATYGGTAMVEMTGSPFVSSVSGEGGTKHQFRRN